MSEERYINVHTFYPASAIPSGILRRQDLTAKAKLLLGRMIVLDTGEPLDIERLAVDLGTNVDEIAATVRELASHNLCDREGKLI